MTAWIMFHRKRRIMLVNDFCAFFHFFSTTLLQSCPWSQDRTGMNLVFWGHQLFHFSSPSITLSSGSVVLVIWQYLTSSCGTSSLLVFLLLAFSEQGSILYEWMYGGVLVIFLTREIHQFACQHRYPYLWGKRFLCPLQLQREFSMEVSLQV